MKDSNTYIDLIICACKKVSEYISGLDEESFSHHSMAQSAIIMQLQIIGEVSKKLDETIQSEVDVPSKMIVGLRNMISHDYFLLEIGTIWNIATINVPELEAKLNTYLHAHGISYTPPFDDTSPLMG